MFPGWRSCRALLGPAQDALEPRQSCIAAWVDEGQVGPVRGKRDGSRGARFSGRTERCGRSVGQMILRSWANGTSGGDSPQPPHASASKGTFNARPILAMTSSDPPRLPLSSSAMCGCVVSARPARAAWVTPRRRRQNASGVGAFISSRISLLSDASTRPAAIDPPIALRLAFRRRVEFGARELNHEFLSGGPVSDTAFANTSNSFISRGERAASFVCAV